MGRSPFWLTLGGPLWLRLFPSFHPPVDGWSIRQGVIVHVACSCIAYQSNRPLSFRVPIQASCHHRNAELIVEIRIDHGTNDHVGIFGGEFTDRAADFLELAHAEIHTRGDVDQDSTGSRQIDILEQWAANCRFRGNDGAVFTLAAPLPIMAIPISDITVRTSAKSTFISPGRVIRSAIP